jgi:hypothetical protein
MDVLLSCRLMCVGCAAVCRCKAQAHWYSLQPLPWIACFALGSLLRRPQCAGPTTLTTYTHKQQRAPHFLCSMLWRPKACTCARPEASSKHAQCAPLGSRLTCAYLLTQSCHGAVGGQHAVPGGVPAGRLGQHRAVRRVMWQCEWNASVAPRMWV